MQSNVDQVEVLQCVDLQLDVLRVCEVRYLKYCNVLFTAPMLHRSTNDGFHFNGTVSTFVDGDYFVRALQEDSLHPGQYYAFVGYAFTRITSNGEMTKLAGMYSSPGYADGLGTSARFNSVYGLISMADGRVIAAEYVSNCLRQIATTKAMAVSTYAGECRGINTAIDGTLLSARFHSPRGLLPYTTDSRQFLVADENARTIRLVNDNTESISTLYHLPGRPQFISMDSLTNDLLVTTQTPNGIIRCEKGTGKISWAVGGLGKDFFPLPRGIVSLSHDYAIISDFENHQLKLVNVHDKSFVALICTGTPEVQSGAINSCKLTYPQVLLPTERGLLICMSGWIMKLTYDLTLPGIVCKLNVDV